MSRYLLFRRTMHMLPPSSTSSTSSSKTRHQLLGANGHRAINQRLLLPPLPAMILSQRRSLGIVAGVLRSVLKIRYIILGGAVGGGIHMNNVSSVKINTKNGRTVCPTLKWIRDMIPDEERQQSLKDNFESLRNRLLAEDGFFDGLTKNASETMSQFREMLKERRERATSAGGELLFLSGGVDGMLDDSAGETIVWSPPSAQKISSNVPVGANGEAAYERIRKLQDELIEIQHKYQKEIERLEKENKELRKSLLLKSGADKTAVERLKKVNKTLIDLYSEVLDELNEFDTNYNTQDHLPRVIVVGDQSAGKTSVLEMIAQARLFPRGAGEMMTRSPVKVTLKEGPYHIARFKDSKREFDLSKESELAELRRDIEIRMKSKVKNGRSVSKDVIALTVEGPGIPRMVLVDLPGVISTVTTEMAADTREAIEEISKAYMNNPNAIILCVQDGSVDAERSIVTDLVAQVDPHGKRTIFVMTKMDLAEKHMANPSRLKKILDGRLFPMKALGYFAVVTGKGGKDDTIQTIRDYEEDFFKNSKLCRQGILNASQCTTQSLSLAVSDCFWQMVKSSVEQQADLYKARKFNLETEWKNTFTNYRELDRDELFEIGKNQILDQIIKLGHLSSDHWEQTLFTKLNEHFKDYIFENIYLPAAEAPPDSFNIQADIRLKNWIDNVLPASTVEVGLKVLSEQFQEVLGNRRQADGSDGAGGSAHGGRNCAENDAALFRSLKEAVAEDALEQHQWDSKAFDVLRLIQANASEDRMISEKERWKESVRYLQKTIVDRIKQTQSRLHELVGPDWLEQWSYWKSRTRQQYINSYIKNELDQIASQNQNLKPTLDAEDILLVKKNLRVQKIEVADEDVTALWAEVYKNQFLKNLLSKAQSCEKLYAHYLYKLDSDISCDDVIFFYRIHHILTASSKALRQQITNIEAQRLNREVKDILDDFNQDPERKSQLLTGKRVNLAEELKRVRQIQEKLEEFIAALNKEK
ncbi:Dynamin-like 120 kDa protein, mitochondrial [Tyrophagus putrescentiae]|nr:Dynamin-like 120 kDa protein, mitochondrial [Tyrophagus putrescentiae]